MPAPRTPVAALLAGLVAALLVPLAGSPAEAAEAAAGAAPDDVPDAAPAAARRAEPRLPVPDGWPFAQRLSRTSGTGRLHGGASYWTDFVHDDKGAAIPSGLTLQNTSNLAPEQGVHEYADPAARGNGADVFVAATGLTDRASYWRVDWNTLADPDVPLAVWALDTDDDATTGASAWPAGAGVSSPGIEKALVVSSRGVWLHDLVAGGWRKAGSVTVDRAARSFVARVPRRLLPVSGTWRVRLGAGLAAADGRSMAPATTAGGVPVPPGRAHVYNLAFRGVRQEQPVHTDGSTSALVAAMQEAAAGTPLLGTLGVDGLARFVTGNFWMEDNQADALAGGDVSRFSRAVAWRRLERREATREPLVRGYSNRWYVSSLGLGQGIVENTDPGGDGRPNYLGRIQPYAVHVPASYDPDEAAPLTWVLHSLGVNHNQYGALNPRLLRQLCDDRGSICATTLGHGPDGWYFDEAEHDYWSVWREVAEAYRLDERRTVLSGYSMGGWATYHLGLAHPDLYAAAVSLAGPPQCGVTVDGDEGGNAAVPGRCTTDGRSAPLVRNATHLPYRIAHGTEDQLVPFTSVEAQVGRFVEHGLRHRFLRYPLEDHLAFATQDRFDTVLDGLGRPVAERRPRTIDHTWRPHLSRPGLGIGTTGAWWVDRLRARDDGPGSLARVRATSAALADRAHDVVTSGPVPVVAPLPAFLSVLGWQETDPLPQRRRLVLDLENAGLVRVDMARAGLPCGRVRVTTDGPTRLVLTDLPGGRRTHDLSAGERTLRLPC